MMAQIKVTENRLNRLRELASSWREYAAGDCQAKNKGMVQAANELDHLLDYFGNEWIELDEKMPEAGKLIDVWYLNGEKEFQVNPVSVELMEVEYWRESAKA